MEDFIAEWKKITVNTISENGAFIHNKNNSVMDAIIKYENEEKESKQAVKKIIFFLVPFLIIANVFQVWIGATEVKTINLIGYALMLFGLLFSFLNNRTDNFPDARILPTTDYLSKVKENIVLRKRKHAFNGLTLLLFYIPGMFLSFWDYFVRGELAPWLNQLMFIFLIVASIGMLIGSYYGFKKYDLKIQPLVNEINEMIKQVKN